MNMCAMGRKTSTKNANAWGELATVESFDAPEELLAAVLSSTGVGVGVFDRRLRYRAINTSLAAMNGFPVEAHLGKKLQQIVGDVASKVGGAIDGVFSTGKALPELEIVAKLPGRKRVGYWVESYQPIKDASGRVQQVAVIVLEVTERKKLEGSIQSIDEKVRRTGAALKDHRAIYSGSSRLDWDDPEIVVRSMQLAEECMAEAKVLSGLLRPVLQLGGAKRGVGGWEFPELMAEAGDGPEGRVSPVENPLADGAPDAVHLSPREQEVLKLLAEGKINKEIAAVLGISPRTVEAHRARVMLKLDLRSVGELVCYAIRHHIIQA
jgi:DNA-binding CsgD family transcriptional regulator